MSSSNDYDDVNATNEITNRVPHNTLAWAAGVLDNVQNEKSSFWRAPPEVLNKTLPRLAPVGVHSGASVHGESTTPSEENKS